jgi:hypothetical protein
MTGTFCTGWDRTRADEWASYPNWWQKARMVWAFRKEMRGW